MAVWSMTHTFVDEFCRAQVLSTTPGHNGWTIAETAGGSPTYLTATEDGGKMVLTCDSTSEVQNLCMFQNDVLMYDLADLSNIWYVAKVASFTSNTTIVMGVGNERNNAPDNVTNHAWFRMEGSDSTSALVVETDDGTNDNDDTATGETLAAVYKRLLIDFSQGLSDVRFFVDGARVARGTTFDMSNVTSGQNVQPIVQLQKASSVDEPVLHIAQFGATYKTSYGS